MEDFIEFCQRVSPLEHHAADQLLSCLREKRIGKGETLLHAGQYCRHLYFLKKGLVKLSTHQEAREFVMRFFNDGMLFTVPDSVLQQRPSNYDLVALEESNLAILSYDDLEGLCSESHQVETFFRRFLGMACTNMMQRINEMLTENATERYTLFLKQHPDLVHRLSLGDIAAYLGITQVSLSRIRAQF